MSLRRNIVSASPRYVRYGSLADIGPPIRDVRFAPESEHVQRLTRRLLCAKSGHGRDTISNHFGNELRRIFCFTDRDVFFADPPRLAMPLRLERAQRRMCWSAYRRACACSFPDPSFLALIDGNIVCNRWHNV